MFIKMKKSKKDAEEYMVEKDPIFSMTEQELEVHIDANINDIDSIKELLKKVIKLARYKKNGNT